MGLLSTLNIGVTGLNAVGAAIGIVGDNIANAQTTGFKYSRPEFQDILALSLKGIEGGDQFGAGTKLAHIKPIFNQGSVTRTEISTDLAIQGNGFFVTKAKFGHAYTRDGAFHFDKEGTLINGDGYGIMGFQADNAGNISAKIEPIKLGGTTIPAVPTAEVKFQMNLDSRADIKQFNLLDPFKTSNFNTSLTVYDNIGTARIVSVFFNKVANSNWAYHVLVDGADAEGGQEGKYIEMASGNASFNQKGVLQQETQSNNNFTFNKGAAPQQIKFDFGKSILEGGNGRLATTQFGSKSAVSRHVQDGSAAGSLTSLSFNDEGRLQATYDNGETRDIAQIALAKFENNEGLFKMGKNLFKDTRKSGQAALGKPGESGRGTVLSKSLELSNVDIANEFINLMNFQRNFAANARTITTADQMLQEVFNIKR